MVESTCKGEIGFFNDLIIFLDPEPIPRKVSSLVLLLCPTLDKVNTDKNIDRKNIDLLFIVFIVIILIDIF